MTNMQEKCGAGKEIHTSRNAETKKKNEQNSNTTAGLFQSKLIGPYPTKMAGKEERGFTDEKEREDASRVLDDPEPPKKGIGDKVSAIKKKLKKGRREGWTTLHGAESTPPSSPKTAAAGSLEPQKQTNNAAAGSNKPQKQKNDADSVESLKDIDKAAHPQPKPRMSASSDKPAVTSTPAKSEEGVLTERVLSLDLSGANATTFKNSSDFTDDEEENPFDGSLEKVDTRTARQINRARRNKMRRQRRKAAELELSKTGPDAKRHKTGTESEMETDTEERKRAPPKPRFQPGGDRPSFSEVVTKTDLVCSLVSEDACRALVPADFTYFNGKFMEFLQEKIGFQDMLKYTVKIGSMHDGYIHLCMETQHGVDFLKKWVPHFPAEEGRPRLYFVEPGVVPYEHFKCYVSCPAVELPDGLVTFCKTIRALNPSLIGGTINARIAKKVERKEEKEKGSFLVMMIRVSTNLVPIIHNMGYKLRYHVGHLVLHKKVDPNAPIDEHKETEAMETERSGTSAGHMGST